ncbi:MAG: cupredoxin domain-containing protein [Deltaproteobacteria bacterium]|nr:cupredoxin domain-containing protein [Deltaproteobacteria bacterium]
MRNHNFSLLRSAALPAALFGVLFTAGAGCKAKSPTVEPPAAAPAAPAAPPTPAGVTRVTVSKDGYTPASITAPAGKDTTLIFRRVDEQNCGDTLVFPKLNIRKDLPLNEDVTVTIPAQQPQELSFTCGMGMYKGALVITAS